MLLFDGKPVKEKIIKFIDSHVHLDHIYSDNADRISWLEKSGCTPVSWSFCKPVNSVADINRCLSNHSQIISELSNTWFPLLLSGRGSSQKYNSGLNAGKDPGIDSSVEIKSRKILYRLAGLFDIFDIAHNNQRCPPVQNMGRRRIKSHRRVGFFCAQHQDIKPVF